MTGRWSSGKSGKGMMGGRGRGGWHFLPFIWFVSSSVYSQWSQMRPSTMRQRVERGVWSVLMCVESSSFRLITLFPLSLLLVFLSLSLFIFY